MRITDYALLLGAITVLAVTTANLVQRKTSQAFTQTIQQQTWQPAQGDWTGKGGQQ